MAKLDWSVVFKKFMMVAVFLAGVFILSLALFGVMLPTDWIVIRDVTIDAKPAQIYPVFADFHAWEQWNPWQKKDRTMKVRIGPKSRGKGAWQSWESPSQGTGRSEITESARNREVTFHTDIKGSWEASFDYRLELQERQDGKTELRWIAFGQEVKLLPKLMAQLLFDRFMGPDFEAGLSNIKRIAEGGAEAAEEAEEEPQPKRKLIAPKVEAPDAPVAAPVVPPAAVEVSSPAPAAAVQISTP